MPWVENHCGEGASAREAGLEDGVDDFVNVEDGDVRFAFDLDDRVAKDELHPVDPAGLAPEGECHAGVALHFEAAGKGDGSS